MTVKRIYLDGLSRKIPSESFPTESVVSADFTYEQEQADDPIVQMTSQHTGPVTNWQWSVDGDEVSTQRDPLVTFVFDGLFKDFTVRMTVWPGPVYSEKTVRVTQTVPVATALVLRTLTAAELRSMTGAELQEMIGA